jgi:hypothetical protein
MEPVEYGIFGLTLALVGYWAYLAISERILPLHVLGLSDTEFEWGEDYRHPIPGQSYSGLPVKYTRHPYYRQ